MNLAVRIVAFVFLVGLIAWMWMHSRPVPLDEHRDAASLVAEAESAMERGDLDSARQLIASALEVDPGYETALLYQGQFQHEAGNYEGALACWARIPVESRSVSSTARYLEGQAWLDRLHAREAERLLRLSLELNPQYVAPFRSLVRLYAYQLRGEEVRKLFARSAVTDRLTFEDLAMELVAGQPLLSETEGIQLMTRLIESDQEDQHSMLALARYHLLRGELVQADEILSTAHRKSPQDLELLGWYAWSLCEAGRYDEAASLWNELPSAEVYPVSLWRVLARMAARSEDWEAAEHAAWQVVRLDPFDVSGRYQWATALSRLNKMSEATDAFRAAEQLDRLERSAFLMTRGAGRSKELLLPLILDIAGLLDELEQWRPAADWLNQALALEPDHPEITRRLVEMRKRISRDAPATAFSETRGVELDTSFVLPSRSTLLFDRQPVDRGFLFVDIAETLQLDYQYFNGASGRKLIVETIGGGVTILDYDLDGWPDLFFPQGTPLHGSPDTLFADRLFRNMEGQYFEDVTEAAGLGDTGFSLACTVGDFDNDGDPDLFLARLGENLLYENNGDGTFTRVEWTTAPEPDECSAAACFVDLDSDGYLDLYVVNYVEEWHRECRNDRGEIATCDPFGFPSAGDRLYWNDGQGGFVDVTTSSGVATVRGKGLGIVAADLNEDGRIDLYVANDGTPNFLWINESTPGKLMLREFGYASGTAVNRDGRTEAGMGIASGDFDGDGRLDLFVTNFYLETNTLYANQGGGLFEDVTALSGMAASSRPVLGFGTQAIDADLDGARDLFIANGDIDDYSHTGRPWKMQPQAFRNDGLFRFTDVSLSSGNYFQQACLGRGMAALDFNRDGKPDLVVVHHDRPAALLQNQTPDTGQSLTLSLRGTVSNRDGLGAIVTLVTERGQQVHVLTSGDGYAASNERLLLVGVGRLNRIEQLVIRWPGGLEETYTDLRSGAQYQCIEGQGIWLVPPR